MANRLLRTIGALALSAVVALAALYSTKLVDFPAGSFFPSSFITHSIMLVCSIGILWVATKGKLALGGFTWGSYRFSPRILAWVLPTATLSTLSVFLAPAEEAAKGPADDFTKLQVILFVWIYASICEEVLTRGLLQTLLSGGGSLDSARPRRLSMPVVLSALFFGAMHIVLVRSMGPAAIPVIVLATFLGLVAARYRERTGSLIPAVMVHMLFNIGGMLPLWVGQWVRTTW